jgi:hypothetical protein
MERPEFQALNPCEKSDKSMYIKNDQKMLKRKEKKKEKKTEAGIRTSLQSK